MCTRRPHIAISLLAGVALATCADAMFMPPRNEPVERLVTNLAKRTKEHPSDVKAWYALGRAHSLAFSRGFADVPTFGKDEPAPDDGHPGSGIRYARESSNRKLPTEELRAHLTEGIAAFRRATQLNAAACEHWMSYAYLIERGIQEAPNVDALPGVTLDMPIAKDQIEKFDAAIMKLADKATREEAIETLRGGREAGILVAHRNRDHKDEATRTAITSLLRDWWREQAVHTYARAFTCSLEKDMKAGAVLGGFQSLISHEAGVSYLRLVRERGERPEDKEQIAAVNDGIKKLEAREYPMIVTPIVFPADHDRSLGSLLDPASRTGFDLDGTGRNQQWPWVKPDTAILVWDPTNSGKITSGRELFGSVSWWIFFDNGYQALDALDDNRDGELTGPELKGIAVWIDRNGNGVSDPGEVVPVESFGIRSIRVRATSTEDGCPANRDGLVMADGRVLPTYDWIAQPATSAPASSTPSQPIASRLRAAP